MTRSLLLCLGSAAALLACALPEILPGTPVAEVLRARGAPTAVYALPASGQRLEYASGPYGRQTWMIDVDAAGRVTRSRQVLGEAEFLAVQHAAPLDSRALLRWLGTPGERRHGGRPGGEVWSWRYPTNDCLWFEFSVKPDGTAQAGGYAIDPRCDGPNERQP